MCSESHNSIITFHLSSIARNSIVSEAGGTDPRSVCLAQSWSDDNNSDEMQIRENRCVGFGAGVLALSAGSGA